MKRILCVGVIRAGRLKMKTNNKEIEKICSRKTTDMQQEE